MQVKLTTGAAVIALAIFVLLAGVASADSQPPMTATDLPPLTQPDQTSEVPATAAETGAVEVTPVALPPVLPAGVQPVQGFLLKRIRHKLVLTRNSVWHLQSLIGAKRTPAGNIWSLGGLDKASKQLSAWKARGRQLYRVWMQQRVVSLQQTIDHQRLVMGLRPLGRTLAMSLPIRVRLYRLQQRAKVTGYQYNHPKHLAEFSCIHYNPRVGHGEGAWNANTGNGFYGGLQMNYGFMASYGGYLLRTKGTADHWTPLEQIWTAEKAQSSRGFYPWPNTARACGLIT